MAANRPLPSPLPADLPEDWQDNQLVAPQGADVGLTEQHGYNYLMQQVNDAQRAANQLKEGQTQFQTALEDKQDKLTGTQGQVVGFDAQGNPVAQAAPSGGVTSFKNRTGAVTPQSGDYSVSQVTGAAPTASPVFTGSISLGRKSGGTIGNLSTAVGRDVIASGYGSHAEGEYTQATGMYSYAEGGDTIASGTCSHAEGSDTKANGSFSHAAGSGTIANYKQFVVGSYNVEFGTPSGTTPSDSVFIVGGGGSSVERVNLFRVSKVGVYGKGSWNSSGADYAELFEWQDRNPEGEDRAGLFVTLDGEHIRVANPEDDFILGVVSATPSVVGDVYDDQWAGMYLRDVFGRTVMAEQDFPAETVERPDADGELETVEIRPAFRELAPIVNPDYDTTVPYQPRTKRPEWDAVGMMGKLVAVDDGTCQVNGWATVGQGGRATASAERTKYRVMARLDETHIRLLIL